MTALAANRNTPRNGSGTHPAKISGGVAASTHIYQGALCGFNASGYVVPASADPRIRVLGAAEVECDNSAGTAAAKSVNLLPGCYWFANSSSTDAIAITEIGKVCFAADDQTVAKTSGVGTRPVAGKVVAVDASLGVAVQIADGRGEVLVSESAFARTDVDINVAATAMTRDLTGTLPVGATVIGYDVNNTADWTDGSTGTFALNLGDGTTATLYGSDLSNIDGGASRTSGAVMKQISTASKVVAQISSSVNLSTLTGGAATVRIFYTLP